MRHSNSSFREELVWNSYFVERIYDRVREEVEFAAKQYEEDTGKDITEEIDDIAEDIFDAGLNSVVNNKRNS